jgi:hypothetical protein
MISGKEIKSLEAVAKFKQLRITATNENCTHEEIKSRLNSGNACYHSVQSLSSFRLLSRNTYIKIHKITLLLLFCTGVKIGLSH